MDGCEWEVSTEIKQDIKMELSDIEGDLENSMLQDDTLINGLESNISLKKNEKLEVSIQIFMGFLINTLK